MQCPTPSEKLIVDRAPVNLLPPAADYLRPLLAERKRAQHADDDKLLKAMGSVLDALHAGYAEPTAGS